MAKLSVLVFVAIAVASATAASEQLVKILRQDQDISPDGTSYSFGIELDNGIKAEEQGSVKATGPEDGELQAQGKFSWTSPEGEKVEISYVADQNGYQPTGSHIPQPPPAILRALEYIAAHPEPESKRP